MYPFIRPFILLGAAYSFPALCKPQRSWCVPSWVCPLFPWSCGPVEEGLMKGAKTEMLMY